MDKLPTDFLFYLHDVAHLLRIETDKRARRHDMTRAQWLILLWLDRQPGISQKELAEILEVEPITVARLVDRLEQRQMVERRPDPKDRRIWRLHLRPDAAPLLDEINQERAEILQMATKDLDAETLRVTTEGLRIMKASLCAQMRCNRSPAATTPMQEVA